MLYRTEREEVIQAARDYVVASWRNGGIDLGDAREAATSYQKEKWPDPGTAPELHDEPGWMIMVGVVGGVILGAALLSNEEEFLTALVGFLMWLGLWIWLYSTLGRDSSAQKNAPYYRWKSALQKGRDSIDLFMAETESSITRIERALRERAAAEKELADAKRRPAPIPGCTPRQAEKLAARWMKYMGAMDARVSQATRDGGVDVISSRFAAEVKHHAVPVGPVPVRAIAGVAYSQGKIPVFFSLNGYTRDAESFGRQAGVLLFVYDPELGTLIGQTTKSRSAIRDGLDAVVQESE